MLSPRTGLLAALAFSILLAPVSASAQLQSEGVVYAYMMMRVGAVHQPVLVPLPAEQVRPDLPLQATVPAAFGLLRYGKPATYGNASVTASDALLAQRRVAVNLDPTADSSAFEVIAAETVLTFSALGIDRVIFPGWADEGLTRADIEYATYGFQVPMWQALVAGAIPSAEIVLLDGDHMDSDEFFQGLNDGDPRLQHMVLDIIGGSNRVARYYVLSIIPTLNIRGYEAAVAPVLSDDPDPAYRVTALNALAGSTDEAAWDAVVGMMTGDPDPELRELAAQALAASPLDAFRVYEVFHRADSADPAMKVQAITEMSSIDDPRVVERLDGYLADADPEIRRLAADGLHGLERWETLRAAMNNDALDAEVRFLAATALADDATGDDRRAGLEYRGMTSVGDVAIAAIDRLTALDGVDVRTTLEGFLGHSDVAVAAYTARTLADLGESDSLDALSEVGRDESRPLDLRIIVGDAAHTILGGLSESRVGSYASGRDPFLKRAAYRALGDLATAGSAGSSVYGTLRDGLASSDAGVRGASARALATYGTREALELIMGLEADPVEEVRADVAIALGSFPGEEFVDVTSPTLVGYVESGDPQVVAGALDALAMLEQNQLLSVVLDKVRFPDARVRASAMRAAAALADPRELQPVINAIGAGLRDEHVPNRVLSAQLLGRFTDSLAVLSLSQVVNGPEPEVRYAAIGALGTTRHPDAVGTLLALLEDPDREIRLASVHALESLNLLSAVPGVQAQLARETDGVSVEALQGLLDHLNSNGI